MDASNVAPGHVVLLPSDPDASARALRRRLHELTGRVVGVVVTDTAGRAWREGQTDIAIGAAGLRVLESFAGRADSHGNPLAVTAPAVADEIAGAAELAQAKLAGRPFAVVRGRPDLVLPVDDDGPGATALVRGDDTDFFGYGAREAVLRALTGDAADARAFGAPAAAEELAEALETLVRIRPTRDGDALELTTDDPHVSGSPRGGVRARLGGRGCGARLGPRANSAVTTCSVDSAVRCPELCRFSPFRSSPQNVKDLARGQASQDRSPGGRRADAFPAEERGEASWSRDRRRVLGDRAADRRARGVPPDQELVGPAPVQQRRHRQDRCAGVGVRQGDDQEGDGQPAARLGRPGDLLRRSPAFGEHYNTPDPMERKLYSEGDRPELGILVHNLEHGYTILWYDETVADDSDQMNELRAIADKFAGTSNLRFKFKAVPWLESDGESFPEGQHIAFTHWSIGGADQDPAGDGQVGVWQYCTDVSGDALNAFMLKYPYMDSPEPTAM